MPEPEGLLASYGHHLVHDVMGWWLANGPDDDHGGVLTCWSNDGTKLRAHDKYTWSQGRWAWVMSRTADAAARGLVDLDAQRCLERAEKTAVFLRDHAVLPDGTTAFVTDRAGQPYEPVPGRGQHVSVFTDLFAALGFAELARVGGDPEWGDRAEQLFAGAADRIGRRVVRTEPYPVPPGFGSFALPMMLVGVGEQVHRATGSDRSAQVVHAAAAEIFDRFRSGDDMAEMPPDDSASSDTLLARHRTPGHVLEALWFLAHAGDLLTAGGAASHDRLADLAVHACRLGWDAAHGGLLRYVDLDGGAPAGRRLHDRYEQLVVDTWDTKLWWPHAEALYTTLLLSRRTGRADIADWHARLHDYTFATFPEGPGREWTQIRDRKGKPLEATVALPVKDPFHVARALLLLVELLAVPGTEAAGDGLTSMGRER